MAGSVITYGGGGAGGGITKYASVAALPASASVGDVAITTDTGTVYEYFGGSWVAIAASSSVLSIGTIDTGTASANGAQIVSNALILQSASATRPGLVNITTQTFAGAKTFTGAITASNLSGTNTGDVTLGATATSGGLTLSGQILSAAQSTGSVNGWLSSTDWTTFNAKQAALTIGNLTEATSSVLTISGGTGAIIGSGLTIQVKLATTSVSGYLSSTDWNTFNGKQAAGNYITALTGDATASGPGSVALTLATVNSNVGSFGSSTAIPVLTVNAKGLVTAASTAAVVAPAGTLTGATLAANVLASSLTSVGTIATGVWNGTTIAIANGGTGQTTAAAAMTALSPLTTKGDILSFSTLNARLAVGSDGQVLTADSAQTLGVKWATPTTGTVTAVSVVSANGFAGSSGGGATPALTLSTTITGVLKGNGTAISAATAGTDYSAGTNALATGILKSTTTTGALTIAVAGDFPTLNQNTTGTAAGLSATLVVGSGGTGLTSGTSGGILGYTASGTLASSAALTVSQLIIGGGAGATPSTLAAGSQYAVLRMGAATPAYGSINLDQSAAVTGALGAANGGTGVANNAASTLTISGNFATTITVTGTTTVTFPTSGTLATNPLTTTGDILYSSSGSTAARLGIGTANQALTVLGSNTTPSWNTINQYPAVNYLNANPNAEVDTGSWTTYADAAQNTPVDATGGSPSSTWTRTTSSPLTGTGSFLWTRTANNRQGEGVAYAFTLNSGDQTKTIAINFDYKIASGTFFAADGITAPLNDGTTSQNAGMSDLEVFIYDVTNAVLIPVSPQVLVSTSTTSATFKGVFQAASNSTSYRLAIHTARSTAVAVTVQFDNFYVGPQVVAYGAPITDWTSYTPTWSASLGTVTSITAQWRRIGDTMYLRGTASAGTTTAAAIKISLPAGYTGNVSSVNAILEGSFVTDYNGATQAGMFPMMLSADTSNIQISKNNSASGFTATNGNAVLGTVFSWTASVPINGWSSSVLMSNDSLTRLVQATYYLSANATPGTNTQINYDTKVTDTNAAVTTGVGAWKFTAPVSGSYNVAVIFYGTTANSNCKLYKNGSAVQNIACSVNSSVTGGGSADIQLVAGDYIDLRPDNGTLCGGQAAPYLNAVSIHLNSGPATLATTDTCSFMYGQAAATAVTSITTMPCDTKTYDTHNAVASGVFTAPVSGKYHFDVGIGIKGATFILNDLIQLDLVQAGSASVTRTIKGYAAAAVTQFPLELSCEMILVAGDTVQAKVTSARASSTLSGTVNENFFGGFLIK